MSNVRDAIADKLWHLFANELVDRLENGEEKTTPDGSVIRTRPGSPTLAVIAKFLKDNDVGGPGNADDANDPAAKLARLLKKAEDELKSQDSDLYN